MSRQRPSRPRLRARFALPLALSLLSAAAAPARAHPPSREAAPAGASPADRTSTRRAHGHETAPPVPDLEVAKHLPARIDAVEVHAKGGLWSTQDLVVRRELPWKPGETVTQELWDRGLRRLWNIQIFSRVSGRIELRGGKRFAIIDVENRWSLVPLFEIHYGGHATWFQAGLSEHNFLGRYLQVDAFYEYFNGQQGGQVIYRDPRLFGERLELRLQAGRTMRPRPEFVVQRARARGDLYRHFADDRIRIGARVEAFDDGFLPSIEEGAPPAPELLTGHTQTISFEPSLRVGRVDHRRIQYNGVSLEMRPQLAQTFGAGQKPWAGFLVELLAYRTLSERFSVGARVQAATQTPPAGRQLQYFLGGLDTIRGYRDSQFRTSTYAFTNVEARFIAFDTDWISCELAVFADFGIMKGLNGNRVVAASVGPGVRFFIPKLVDSELRLDLALPLINAPFGAEPNVGTEPFF